MLFVFCQLSRDVRAFDPSIVTVKESFIFSQIVSWASRSLVVSFA